MIGHRSRSATLSALLATTALAVWAAPASAANQAEANRIQQAVEAWLEDSSSAATTIAAAGGIDVAIDGEAYVVTLADLALVIGDPDVPSIELGGADFGDLTITIVPDPVDPDMYSFDATFGEGDKPVTFVIHGEDGSGEVIIGNHHIGGDWSADIDYATSLDILFDNLVAQPTEGADMDDGRLTVAELSLVLNMLETRPGLWDGDAEIRIADLVAEVEGQVPLQFTELSFYENFGGFAFSEYMDYAEEHGLTDGQLDEPGSQLELFSMIKRLVLDMPTVVEDFSLGWYVAGLTGGAPGDQVFIDEHSFEFGIFGLGEDTSNWILSFYLQGLDIPQGDVPENFVPTIVDVEITANDVPTGLGWGALEDTVGGSEIQDMDAVGPMLGQQFVQLMLQSGTSMDIVGDIGWETGLIQFEGGIAADASSPFMTSGGLTIVVNEMAAMIDEVGRTVGNEQAAAMTMIQAMGQADEDANGTPLTIYDFEITSGGEVRMNGQDLDPLLGNMPF